MSSRPLQAGHFFVESSPSRRFISSSSDSSGIRAGFLFVSPNSTAGGLLVSNGFNLGVVPAVMAGDAAARAIERFGSGTGFAAGARAGAGLGAGGGEAAGGGGEAR